MYSSSYARAKSAPEAREPPHRPRGKSCGYYMRIVFFFSSLIQSLIIISLVLFLIYGQPEKSAEEKRVQVSAACRKCKEDFAQSLDGIKTVTSSFLNKINNLFPHQLTFHLTCDRQQDQMEKIRSSCTNLSRDVENKFQLYLDNVGHKVAEIQAKSSVMEVQNSGLTSDLQQCQRTHSEAVAEATRQQQLTQTAHDNQPAGPQARNRYT
ncbi:Plasmalemma vesicle-associated protein [Liparis tanakae]|uniref:Plasmalemma vesicle-associated protein n=1 Tax=Liparis tanakae TaxID=230148 RepID=A0A4Z2F381_9TELE|nr:Plasmalemma vesicle-associated protein [Liparis tanakae]